MKRFLISALAAMALVPLAAAQQGSLNLLCSPDLAWCEALAPAFTEATGYDIEWIRLSSNDALARLRAESANPIYDVWFGGTGDPHLVGVREGVTTFYEPSNWDEIIPSLKSVINSEYIPLYAGALGFSINEEVLEEAGAEVPTSWADLADESYRGLIAMPDPNSSGTAYTIIATLVQIFGEDEAFELLEAIHMNVAQYTSSGSAPGQLAGRGEVGIAVQFMHDGVKFANQGFPLITLAPSEGTGYEIGGLSLVTDGPNPEAAIAFIEWALTPEAQLIAADRGESFQIQSNMNTPVNELAPDLDSINLIEYDFDTFGNPDMRNHLVSRWTNEIFPIPR